MRVKKVFAVALAVSMVASLAVTASAEEEGRDIPAYGDIVLGEDYTDLEASIKFIHHKTDREADGKMAEMIAEFNEVYPGIEVSTEGITDYAEDSLLRLSTGDWGDIMMIPAIDKNELPTYFYPYGTVDEMLEVANFSNLWSYDGLSYGIPYMGEADGVVYNKAVFEEAGITEIPKTPEEFHDALQAISDNTDAIPLYTNYAAGWTMGSWDAYIGIVTDGDDTYMNQKFAHDEAPFENKGDYGAYALYEILYDAVADGLIEDDYTTTDWEGCKGMINNGEIGCMVLGSWAYAQMVEAGDHGDDIGYMPFPISIDGTQYASAGGDYNYGINVNSSADNITASLIFVKWMTEESGWCEFEGGYPIDVNGDLPEMYAAFDDCVVLSNQDALPGEETLLDDMNAESELSFNAGGDSKVQAIVEAAFNGSETLDEIMASWTAAWNDAQDYLGVETQTY